MMWSQTKVRMSIHFAKTKAKDLIVVVRIYFQTQDRRNEAKQPRFYSLKESTFPKAQGALC